MSKIKEVQSYIDEQGINPCNLEISSKSFLELVVEATHEATRRGIEANSIIINQNMVEVPEIFANNPHMICGLHVHLTKKELPDGYSFAVCQNPNFNPHRLLKFESIGMEPEELMKAAEMYKKAKEIFGL